MSNSSYRITVTVSIPANSHAFVFVVLILKPYFALTFIVVFKSFCYFSRESAVRTVSPTYMRFFTFCLFIFMPGSSCRRCNIISLYTLNGCGKKNIPMLSFNFCVLLNLVMTTNSISFVSVKIMKKMLVLTINVKLLEHVKNFSMLHTIKDVCIINNVGTFLIAF